MPSARRLLLLGCAAAAVLALPAAASAAGLAPSKGDQIVFSGTVTVPRGEVVDEVVVLHGEAVIEGVALGDVVVFDGAIVVTGQVSGSVIAVNGPVRLGPSAQVGGDVLARGLVEAPEGVKVDGEVRQHVAFMWRTPASLFGRFASWLAVTVSTLVLGLLAIFLTPRAADAVFAALRTSPWSSMGWGAALTAVIPVVALLAVASIVALPFGFVVALALAFVAFAGYALSAYVFGRLFWGAPKNRAIAFLIGWAILRAVGMIPYTSGITFGAGAVVGLGGAAVAIWRARAIGGKHREGRAAVPLPEEIKEEAGF
ncbi:MAG: polymer-forming cytoskeletal protein [Actinomycetota bacterium]